MEIRKPKILPSAMCCRSQDLEGYMHAFERVGIDAIHFDVMDGHYVPNVMLGVSDFTSIRSLTNLPIDVHLMCVDPERFVSYFDIRAGDWMSFHPEVCQQPYALLDTLRKKGIRAGLALSPAISLDYVEECLDTLDFVLVMAVNPGFAGQTMVAGHLEKLRRIHELISHANHRIDVIVDGNTTVSNARQMLVYGATGLVTGTSSMLKDSPDGFESRYASYVSAVTSTDEGA